MPILHAVIQTSGQEASFAAGSYSFHQVTDYEGRPSSSVRVGLIQLTIVGEAASWLMWEEWMLDPHRRQSGRLVFYQNEEQTAKTVVFYDAFCVQYECRFDARGQSGKGSFETEIHLSAAAEEVQGQFSEAHSVIPWPTDEATRKRALTKPIDQLPSVKLTAGQAISHTTNTSPSTEQSVVALPTPVGNYQALASPPALAQLDLESTLDHVEYRDFSVPRNNGIGGAHNQTEWARHSTDYTEISRIPNPDVPGVEQVKYQIPALDRERKPTGQLRAKVYDKSVYNPHIWPRTRLKKSLQEAIQDAYSKNGNSLAREWSGRTAEGYPVRGFYDAQDKKITTFFFEFLN